MKTPFLLNKFPLYKKGKVIIENETKYVVYSDDSPQALILGMGITHQEAVGNAEVNTRKMVERIKVDSLLT